MDKLIAEDFSHEESTEWSFPVVDLIIEDESTALVRDQSQVLLDAAREKEEAATHIVAEAEKLKYEYHKRLDLLNKLITKLDNPMAILDKEMQTLLQYVIKAAVKKLIYKEIESDPELLTRVIDEVSGLIQEKDGMLTVFLSELDYSRIVAEHDQPTRALRVNSTLREGDVIVKSNFSEIRAVLDERINQILGMKNV